MALFEVVVRDVGEHCVPCLVGAGVGVVGGMSELERAPLADCCGRESGSPKMAEHVSLPGLDVV